jgi:hypothetical protein
MKSFLSIALCNVSVSLVLSVSSFVSCGAVDQHSELASHRHPQRESSAQTPHQGPSSGGYEDDRLPGQINGATDGRYPQSPDLVETPGSLCENSNTYRYPEHVKYCERNVDSSLKKQLFLNYDEKFNFETSHMQRSLFKIDHLIPLCLGGSNEASNLWPQHIKIYTQTDPMEPYLCGLLAERKITQAEAVKIIRTIKQSPFTASQELSRLQARF